MRKNLIIAALVITNAVLVFAIPKTKQNQAVLLVALTVNRVFHEQLDGKWPEAYGSTMEQARKFEEEIVAASKQGCTDWSQYKR